MEKSESKMHKPRVSTYELSRQREGRTIGVNSGKPYDHTQHKDPAFVIGFAHAMGIDGHKMHVVLRPFVRYEEGGMIVVEKNAHEILSVCNGNGVCLDDLVIKGYKEKLCDKDLHPIIDVAPALYDQVKFLVRMEALGGGAHSPEEIEKINEARYAVYSQLIDIIAQSENIAKDHLVKRIQKHHPDETAIDL